MLKKNVIVELEITDITNEGNGVGRYEGMAVFVPLTAVGDRIVCRIVKLGKSYCYGIIENLLTPSEHRTEQDCPVYKQCGGCSFRHFSYEEECRLKNSFVKETFKRIGGLEPEFEPFVGAENITHYRNKAQYPVAEQNGKAVCGFYAKRSHRVCMNLDCNLQPEIFANIVTDIMDYVNAEHIKAYNEEQGTGLLRHIYLRRGEHSGQIMLCLIVTDISVCSCFDTLFKLLSEKYSDIKSIVLNENSRNTNRILGEKNKTVYGSDTIEDIMCGNRITISPLSFYQVNTVQAERLYAKAQEYAELSYDTTLLDLYCGAGTIGLSMADKVKKLIGVEVIPQAIENAKLNALNNGITNAEFICGDAGKTAKLLFDRGEQPDVIIADPARKGCTKDTLEYMRKMSPERIVMISCNPATAARDCAILGELGYRAEKITGFDLFPRTTHVECVVSLKRYRETIYKI
ncbi:MAG: 23S rRNA (uracil(1939)-C(5))-methyltransferase RlmD [Ruminococcus sp.]|nr:23S rRNA (uracil(1939)-C(5))-methyltransferase RlmD [Ruminococcus sp.]